jgi:hypothetical protein
MPRDRHRTLGYLLEHVTPEPLDGLHWCSIRLDSGSWLVCAARIVDLRSLPPHTLLLGPESIPEHLSVPNHADIANNLNLLTGNFEPKAVHSQRARWNTILACVLFSVSVFLAIGLERRAIAARRTTEVSRNAALALYDAVLGPSTIPGANRHHLLVGELRKLERTRPGESSDTAAIGSARLTGAVLAAWPTENTIRAESLIVSSGSVRISALFPDNDAVSRFEQHWRERNEWSMQSPRITTQRDGVRLAATLTVIPRATQPDGATP